MSKDTPDFPKALAELNAAALRLWALSNRSHHDPDRVEAARLHRHAIEAYLRALSGVEPLTG